MSGLRRTRIFHRSPPMASPTLDRVSETLLASFPSEEPEIYWVRMGRQVGPTVPVKAKNMPDGDCVWAHLTTQDALRGAQSDPSCEWNGEPPISITRQELRAGAIRLGSPYYGVLTYKDDELECVRWWKTEEEV